MTESQTRRHGCSWCTARLVGVPDPQMLVARSFVDLPDVYRCPRCESWYFLDRGRFRSVDDEEARHLVERIATG